MLDDLELENKINVLLSKVAVLESDLAILLAKQTKKTTTSQEQVYIQIQKAQEEINALMQKHNNIIDKELEAYLQSTYTTYLKTDLRTYRLAYKLGLIATAPYISEATNNVLKQGYTAQLSHIKATLDSVKFNANAQVDTIIRDIAYKKFTLGYNNKQILEEVAQQIRDKGIVVTDSAGRTWHDIVAYNRMSMTTASNNIFSTMQEQLANDIGIPRADRKVQVSSHFGSRPDHAKWQGKIYNIDDFEHICKPHTVTGIYGINCRHKHYEYIEGVSTPVMTQYDEDANKKQYELTQDQRYFEAGIRRWKLRRDVGENLGLDNSYETGKVRHWQGRMRELIDSNDSLKRLYAREQI